MGTVADAPPADSAKPCARLKLNELFMQWFNLPETQHMLHLVLEEASRPAAAGGPSALLHAPPELRSPPGSPTANGLSSLSLGSSPSTPPRSPELLGRGSMRAVLAASAKAGGPHEADTLAATVRAVTAASLTTPHALSASEGEVKTMTTAASATAAAGEADAHVLIDMLPPPISLEPATKMEIVGEQGEGGGEGDADDGGGASGMSATALSAPAGGAAGAQRRHEPGALSPQKRPLTAANSDADTDECTPTTVKEARTSGRSIAPFYLPLGRQPADEREREAWLVRTEIQRAADGAVRLTLAKAVELMKRSFELPSAAARVLGARLAAENGGGAPPTPGAEDSRTVPVSVLEAFHAEWLCGFPPGARLFHALRTPNAHALDAAALRPLVRAVVDHHPGLAFLETAPEFQERYVETVVLRILYTIARCGPPEVTRSALERSSLPSALRALDADDDINRSTAFFSYEHFYVIYCRFWELDDDHDMQLSQEDLARYDNYSLSSRIIERVYEFAVGARRGEGQGTHPSLRAGGSLEPAGGGGEPKMTYPQFVWFVLSEEDKNSPTALEYWFRRVDLDGDGYISGFEMEHFYSEQLHRMRCMGQEPVELPDIVCQMFDLVQPPSAGCGFSLRDLRKCKLAGRLFDVLFNLNKFVSWEAKDPHTIREERALHHMSEWDRFCKREYVRLALEDDAPDESDVDWGVPGLVDDEGPVDGTGADAGGKMLSSGGNYESPF